MPTDFTGYIEARGGNPMPFSQREPYTEAQYRAMATLWNEWRNSDWG